ncbi:MAG: RloB domain-containing protein [Erysipelotrichaceae bacterium]|nr:RloB domain-containing protein [Erysipelotrichaceae bacterium]
MVKRIKKTVKNKPTRERKKIIVIGTEGNNKTEVQYFRNLERQQSQYRFIFAQGNETDPIKILKNTIHRSREEELSFKNGDMSLSVFDLDLDISKVPQLDEAKKLAKKDNTCIITSNPCFEIWYLEHFGYTSKSFSNSRELIRELKKHIPDYQKNTCDFKLLFPLTDQAIKNCKSLDEHHCMNSEEIAFEFSNPRTDVYKIIEKILFERGDNK